MADFMRDAVQRCSPDDVFSVRWLESVLDSHIDVILGPAELNYADDTTFRLTHHECVRPLSALDSDAYHALVRALGDVEVTESGVSAEKFPAFGSFSDNTLCAVASYKVWGASIAHISVATHPEYRRRGFAKAAVQALAAEAIDLGLILQWQSLTWNKRSLALAADLGFEHYASKIFVRLKM
jgi:GNAT superfamily N-acetyltransferase